MVEKDPAKATTQLLELSGLKKYMQRLRTAEEKEHFQKHLRKYVTIYMPDSSFEVTTTNRYTIETQEASVTARREIKKGEMIRYLSGIQVPITGEELDELDLTRRDFSIVMSSRKKTPSLFLGPARFANHDCDANSRLTTKGSSGMAVVAVKDIEVGDEITVTYGADYFGLDNCECLCATCESRRRNGWATRDGDEGQEMEQSSQDVPYPKRGSRKRQGNSRSGSASLASTPELSTPSRKRKLNMMQDSRSNTPRLDFGHGSKPERTSSNLRREVLLDDVDTSSQDTLQVNGLHDRDVSAGISATPSRSGAGQSPVSEASTSATSMSGDAKLPDKSSAVPLAIDATLSKTRPEMTSGRIPLFNVEDMDLAPESSDTPGCQEPGRDTDVARSSCVDALISNAQLDIITSRHPQITQTIEEGLAAPSDSSLSEDGDPAIRTPGDYTLTRALLSTPYSRWVRCQNCEEDFVQTEAFQTRSSCPRCERHSKIYGYQWPKTEKVGKHDTEERILDHRTVHRFVYADEEKTIRKGKKALEGLRESATQESAEPEEEMTPSRTRGRRRQAEDHSREVSRKRKFSPAKPSAGESDQESSEDETSTKRRSSRRSKKPKKLEEEPPETPRGKRRRIATEKSTSNDSKSGKAKADEAAVAHVDDSAQPTEGTTRKSNRRVTISTLAALAQEASTTAPSPTTKRKYVHSGLYVKAKTQPTASEARARRASTTTTTAPEATPSARVANSKHTLTTEPAPSTAARKRKYTWSGRYARDKPPGEATEEEVAGLKWLQKGRPRRTGVVADAEAEVERKVEASSPVPVPGKLRRPTRWSAVTEDVSMADAEDEEAVDEGWRRGTRVRRARVTM